MSTIADNIRIIKTKIEKAARRAGRDASDIKLVAATKDVPASLIEEAIRAGITDIGENRVQEAREKFDLLKEYPVTWHMIGHLQTNKVKPALDVFSVIQSVDSRHLAEEISRRAQRQVQVFMEVNTSGETSKFGVLPGAAAELAEQISALPNLKLSGLMTIGPLTSDEQAVRNSFRLLRDLFGEIKRLNLPQVELKYMSMGMSEDYEVAVEEGSNLVRIGRAIFGIEHKRR